MDQAQIASGNCEIKTNFIIQIFDDFDYLIGSLPLASQSSATTPSRSFISSNKYDS
jgi:hypothetical protein